MGQGELPLLNSEGAGRERLAPLSYFWRHSLRGDAALFLTPYAEQQFDKWLPLRFVFVLCILSDGVILRPVSVLSYSTVEKAETFLPPPL